eukprot:scaffold116443_cov50-Tisochrysis_lutea.AAC.1
MALPPSVFWPLEASQGPESTIVMPLCSVHMCCVLARPATKGLGGIKEGCVVGAPRAGARTDCQYQYRAQLNP